MDGVKLIANGIALEKKVVKKENEAGKSSRRRSATHNVTNITKSADSDIVIDATAGKGKKKSAKVDENSVNRTEENNENENENEKESEE